MFTDFIIAIANRNRFPESSLWESEAGQQWLRYLVVASIFVFALQGGIGCERLSQFFRLLRLERTAYWYQQSQRADNSQLRQKWVRSQIM